MKILKWVLIVIGSLVVLGFIGSKILIHNTKKASPEARVEYNKDDLSMSVFYCRPYKKDRKIFGELVAYNKIWRTGANEATTFTTDQTISFGGEELAAGTYTLWTIPNPDKWNVILNSKMYGWGVDFSMEAQREPEFDVVNVKVPIEELNETVEQFTISFSDEANLELAWDQTRVSVPIVRQ